MGVFFDFAVRYDPKTDTKEQLTERILYSLFIRRNKAKKPNVTFIAGDSGEGKSLTALTLMLVLLKLQGIDFRKYLNAVNVYTPLEYPQKLDNLLFNKDKDKELKKVNVLCVHEAREVIKAKNWHTFLNQAISDVNAMSRAVKRISFFIISQFIRDISSDIRYTINYYITVRRPIGKKARLFVSVLWKDDRDIEKPRLRRRRLRGYIIDNKGKRRLFQPKYIEVTKPPKDIIEEFEKRDFEAKAKIIRGKIEKLISEMKVELQVENKKIGAMVKWYMENQEHLNKMGKRVRGKWRVKPEVKVMHDLTDIELKEFESKLNEEMKIKKMV